MTMSFLGSQGCYTDQYQGVLGQAENTARLTACWQGFKALKIYRIMYNFQFVIRIVKSLLIEMSNRLRASHSHCREGRGTHIQQAQLHCPVPVTILQVCDPHRHTGRPRSWQTVPAGFWQMSMYNLSFQSPQNSIYAPPTLQSHMAI